MFKAKESPFSPGSGLTPPLRAGHDEAVDELEERLRRIRGRNRGDIVVLHGPRGNGKTVLLTELQRKAKRGSVLSRELTDVTIAGGPEHVAQVLQHGHKAQKPRVQSVEAGALSFKGGVALADLPMPQIEQTLFSVLKKKPMLLVVDEAHELPLKFGKGLLQVAQGAIKHDLPLLLVLAGTPGVRAHLRKMGASFWERSRKLRIGRLESDDAVRQALAVPAKKSGYPIDEDALELLVRESQRYPFFVQVLGHVSWKAARSRKGASRITLADAQAGLARAGMQKKDFYLERYREAETQGVLDAALSVSEEFLARGENSSLNDRALATVLEKATEGTGLTPLEARERLSRLGFVWENVDGDWEPGIPSLCAYFVGQAKR